MKNGASLRYAKRITPCYGHIRSIYLTISDSMLIFNILFFNPDRSMTGHNIFDKEF